MSIKEILELCEIHTMKALVHCIVGGAIGAVLFYVCIVAVLIVFGS